MRMQKNIVRRAIPIASLAKKAHDMSGILSKIRSGSGGYFCMSGTRSCTTVRTNDVHKPIRNR